jgi:hypothetical protein
MKVVYEVRDNAGGYDEYRWYDEYPDETLVAIHASLPEAEEYAEQIGGYVRIVSEEDIGSEL